MTAVAPTHYEVSGVILIVALSLLVAFCASPPLTLSMLEPPDTLSKAPPLTNLEFALLRSASY